VQDYHVALDINISFKRTPAAAASAVIVSNDPNDPNAVHVSLSEEDIRKQYPWDYATLTERLQNRYIDFKANGKYHDLRKKLAVNPQYKKTRYLDPTNTSGLRKDFYNPNIVAQFDKRPQRGLERMHCSGPNGVNLAAFLWRGHSHSGFSDSVGRMQCDHKPTMRRKRLD
jgi:hypothetical protein